MAKQSTRVGPYVILLALLMACGTPLTAWVREVGALAPQPLDCPEAEIAVTHHQGHIYDALGCGRAVRYSCRDRVCEPTGEAVGADNAGFRAASERIAASRAALQAQASALSAACAEGGPFAATIVVAADGTVHSVQAREDRRQRVLRSLEPLPAGRGYLRITQVFRP